VHVCSFVYTHVASAFLHQRRPYFFVDLTLAIPHKVHQRIWSYHVGTDFFSPFPSPVDNHVISIFSRDFKGAMSCAEAESSDLDVCIPSIPARCSPAFDVVVDCTRRLCRQASLLTLLLSLLLFSSLFSARLCCLTNFNHSAFDHPRVSPLLIGCRCRRMLSQRAHSTRSYFPILVHCGSATRAAQPTMLILVLP
jgi:hypothetical protein